MDTNTKKIKLTVEAEKTVDFVNSEEIEATKRENVQLKEELKDTKNKLKGLETLVDMMKDKVECPVCLEIPRSGPIPVCPNGHFVCKKCKKDTCPTCRGDMNQGKSLMANILIEYIDHKCKFVKCDQSFKLADYEKHTKVCAHRTISCPAALCKEEVPLSSLIGDHAVDCKDILQVENTVRKTINFNVKTDIGTLDRSWSWNARHMVLFNKHFFFKIEMSGGTFNAVMLMAGSVEECEDFLVDITIHKKSEAIDVCILKYQFSDHPCSIDVEKDKRDDQGLSIGKKAMDRVFEKSGRVYDISLTFEIQQI